MATGEFFDFKQTQVRRSMAFLALGALVGLVIAGYGLFTAKGTRSYGVPPEAIALVNQRPILRSDFMTQAQTQFGTPFAETTAAQRHKVLEDMIDEELTVQRGLEMDLPSYDPDVRVALVAGVELEVTADVLAQQPTDAELRGYYTAHQDRYSSEGLMQLRDLLIKPGPTRSLEAARTAAVQAVAQLRSGQTVEKVMKRLDLADSGLFTDAGQVDTGEIFQFAVKAKFSPRLYAAALNLSSGQVSDPIAESDGVHVIVMKLHRLAVPQTFEQASGRVWTDLKSAAQASIWASNLQYLRGRADIVVAPEYSK